MTSLVKTNIKLTVIISIFVLILFSGNILFLDYNLDKNIEYTCEEHYSATVKHIENLLEGLYITTEKISNNTEIINVLENNRSFNDLDYQEIDSMKSNINVFEGLLKSLSFVNTINISSIRGSYLFSKGIVYGDFNVDERPWFKEEFLNKKGQSALLSSIHKDFNTGKHTVSIVSFINSQVDEELLGVVILDIFIEDLLNYINNTYHIGKINSYIRFDNGSFYGTSGEGNPQGNIQDKIYTVSGDVLGGELILEYDINSISYTESFEKFKNFQILFYSLFGLLLTIILIILVKYIFNPITNAIDRFKSLIETKEEDITILEEADELKQLESIAESLSLTFNKKMQRLIYYDELTKLPNRKQLYMITNNLIKHSIKFALIFIDLNKFKQINDFFGHLVGDEVLKIFSKKLSLAIGNNGIVIRYSGDEFIIVYTNYSTEEALSRFYEENVLPEFKEPIIIDNNKISLEFAAGVSIFPKDGQTLDELIKDSDFIMYKNKKSDIKGELLFFNDDIYKNLIRIESIKSELKDAVKNKELSLYYQPIIDKNHLTRKLEALIRWNSKKLGFISPVDFIPYAEETGDIIEIGYWIVEEVCRSYNTLQGNLEYKLMININVSPIQLMKDDFILRVKEITDKYNISYSSICFEITESVFLDEYVTVNDNLNGLAKLGFKLALDDFGTGYSSFSYLKKFKLDTLKLDKMFITNASDSDYKIIENIIKIASHLDMNVVIEGVEEEEQFKRLKDINCDLFQGYKFSKPLDYKGIIEFLNK